MYHHTRILSLCCCMASLSACTIDDPGEYTTTQTYYTYSKEQAYYQNTYDTQTDHAIQYAEAPVDNKPVSVPDSTLVSVDHAPQSHSDVDRAWVNRQNTQHYTIELAHSDKASQVAGALYKAPKNERTAEIKYEENGKAYYKGFYGSYPTQQAAEAALNQLPNEIKASAGIKTWGSVAAEQH